MHFSALMTDCAFQSHFSIKKGAAALGIGTESVICIKADERLVWLITTAP